MNTPITRLLALCSVFLFGSLAAHSISWTPGWTIPAVGEERPVLAPRPPLSATQSTLAQSARAPDAVEFTAWAA